MRPILIVLALGFLAPGTSLADILFEDQVLLPSGEEPPLNGQHGWSLAADGNIAVVGNNAGGWEDMAREVYFYRHNGSEWTEEQKISKPSGSFGLSVSVSGDAAVVGSRTTAWFYRYNGTTWEEELVEVHADDFGWSVAVSGDVAAVGQPCHGGSTCDGFVHMYEYDGVGWSETQVLGTPESCPSSNCHFGQAVALDGDVLVVGAPAQGALDTGAAYIYRRTAEVWTFEQELTLPAVASAKWGGGVAVDGDVVVVGPCSAPTCPTSATCCPDAHGFRFNGTSWVEEFATTHGYGTAVDVSGSTIVATTLNWAHAFQYVSNAWANSDTLAPTGFTSGIGFGSTIALSDVAILVGAPGYGGLGEAKGAVYSYDLTVPVSVPTGPSTPLTPPASLVLRAFGNPGPSKVSIAFSVPKNGDHEVRVLDVGGRVVKALHSGVLTAGVHTLIWDGRDDAGVPVSSGIYFVRAAGPTGEIATTKVTLLR